MSSDRELLEMAAKALGWSIRESRFVPGKLVVEAESDSWIGWNPLRDDGDALRVAVKLGLRVFTPDAEPTAVADRYPAGPRVGVDAGDDPYAATRRAIVRAAAEIAKAMP